MALGDLLIEHLLRRAGFGASANDLAVFGQLSYSDAVTRLVDYGATPDDVDSRIGQPGYVGTTSSGAFSPNTVVDDARQRLLFRMVHSQRPLQEKMTLFWHNYFATGYTKIAGVVQATNATRLMAAKASEDPQGQQGQIELLRANALGNFRQLLLQIAQDPAMLIWLDGDTNIKSAPQQNWGRELMELFSRGIGYYTEDDVVSAARVFTGWNLQISGAATDTTSTFNFLYRAAEHDTDPKTFSFPIYPGGGPTIPARAASAGMQDGVDLITALAGSPQTAQRMAGKLYNFFVSETNPPDPTLINQIATVYLQSDTEMQPVIEFILTSPQFQDPSNFYTHYSWPAEFVTKAIKETGWAGLSVGSALAPLVNMGQQLLNPPNVAGWILGPGWFSTGAMLARMNFASSLGGNQRANLAAAASASTASPQALLDYLLTRLTPADLDTSTYGDLVSYGGAGVTWTGSAAQLQSKAAGLTHLILGSPEYQLV